MEGTRNRGTVSSWSGAGHFANFGTVPLGTAADLCKSIYNDTIELIHTENMPNLEIQGCSGESKVWSPRICNLGLWELWVNFSAKNWMKLATRQSMD